MAKQFKIKHGLVVDEGGANITGSLLVSGSLTLPDGTSSDLALNFSSSANSGLYLQDYAGGGKQLVIRLGGVTRGSVSLAGIQSSGNLYTADNGQFRNFGGVWKATTGQAGGDAQFILNGKTIMHLDEADERVGIGTTNPFAQLEVVKDSYTQIRVRGNSDVYKHLGLSHGGNFAYVNASRSQLVITAGDATYQYPINFYTGGSERLRISEDGNVGINKSNPFYPLDVEGGVRFQTTAGGGGDGVIQLGVTGNNGYSRFTMGTVSSPTQFQIFNAGDWRIGSYGSQDVSLYTNNIERLRLDQDGNVGIGTTSPTPTSGNMGIHILAPTNKSSELKLDTTDSDRGTYITFAKAGVDKWDIYSTGDGSLRFRDKTLPVVTTPLTLLDGGNVGIGTTAPTHKLHVSGTYDVVKIEGSGSANSSSLFEVHGNNGLLFAIDDDLSDSLFSVNTVAGLPVIEAFADNRVVMGAFNQNDLVISGSKVGIGTASPAAKLHVEDIANPRLLVKDSNGAGIYTQAYNGYGILSTLGSTSYMTFGINDVEKMRLANDGNVGIGTTTPGHKLDVAGSGRVDGRFYFATDGSGGNGLNYRRVGTNVWSLDSSGVGEIYRISGNSITFKQDTTIERGGLTVAPSLQRENGALTINHNWNDAARSFTAFDINVTDTNSLATSKVVDISVGGTTGFIIDKDLNVGIGTATPSEKLEVAGDININSGGIDRLKMAGNNILEVSSNHVLHRTPAGGRHRLIANGNETMTILATGVGIGTTAPARKLSIYEPSTSNVYLQLANSTSGAGNSQGFEIFYGGLNASFVNRTTTGFIDFETSGSSTFKLFGDKSIQISGYGSGTHTGTPAYRLSVDSSGNLIEESLGAGAVDGLGSARYLTRWEDSDTITSSSIYEDSAGNIGIGNTTPGTAKVLIDHTNTKMLELRRNGVTKARFIADSNNGQLDLYDSTTTNTVRLLSNGVSYFNGGNIGIGTASPSAKLEISGSVKIDKGHLIIDGETHSRIYLQNPGGAGDSFIGWWDSNGSYDWYFGQTSENGGLNMYNYAAGGTHVSFNPDGTTGFGLGNVTIANDLIVGGTVTAQEFHTEFVSASIVYQSGSTKFGDTDDDVHAFTGSLEANNLRLSGSTLGTIDTTRELVITHNNTDIDVQSADITIKQQGGGRQAPTGDINILGAGGTGGGTGTIINITAGDSGAGIPGGINLTAGTAQANKNINLNQVAGGITLTGGNHNFAQTGTGDRLGGSITLRPGYNTADNSANGNVDLQYYDSSAYVTALSVEGSSGNVGIGTTTPSSILEISDNTPILKITDNRNLNVGDWDDVSLGALQFATSDTTSPGPRALAEIEAYSGVGAASGPEAELVFKTSTITDSAPVSRMVIDSEGRLGLGTTNPGETFQLHDANTTSNPKIKIFGYDTATSSAKYGQLFVGTDGSFNVSAQDTYLILSAGNYVQSNSVHVFIQGILQSNNKGISMQNTQGSYKTVLITDSNNIVKVGAVGASWTTGGETAIFSAGSERVRIATSGNVGIGTTSPGEALDVDGNIIIRSTDSIRGIRRQNDGYNLQMMGGTSPSDGAYLSLGGDSRGGLGNPVAGEATLVQGGAAYANRAAISSSMLFQAQSNLGTTTDMAIVGSTGNVGIGTTSPTTKLHVVGLAQINENGNTAFYGGNYVRVFSDQNFNIRNVGGATIANISVNGDTYFNGGNVGIGTATPAKDLVVNSTVNNGGIILQRSGVDVINISRGGTPSIEIGTTLGATRIRLVGGDGSYFRDTVLFGGETSRSTDHAVEVKNGTLIVTGSNGPALIASSSGQVGIGTSTPEHTLDVSGSSVRFYHGYSSRFEFGRGLNEYHAQMSSVTHMALQSGGSGMFRIQRGSASNVNFEINQADNVSIGKSAAMYVSSSGDVGIGTTTPAYPLEVAGNLGLQGDTIYMRTDIGGSHTLKIGAPTTAGSVVINRYLSISTSTSGVVLQGHGNVTENLTLRGNDSVSMATSAGYALYATSAGDVGIGTNTPAEKLTVEGNISGSGNLTVAGAIEGASKSFNIPHPTQPGKKLIYGSLEGPEHGVYARGQVEGNVIELPEEWTGLVDDTTITVQLTSIGSHQNLYVADIKDNKVFIKNGNTFSSKIKAFYFIQAMRKDIDKLQTVR